MSLVTVQGLSLGYGARTLFEDLSLVIGPNDRVGLVGPNGAGKSSLMKLLAGTMSADTGTIVLSRGGVAGYLPQELVIDSGASLLDYVLGAVPNRRAVLSRLAEVEHQLAAATLHDAQMALSAELAELVARQHLIEQAQGPHRAAELLSGLGFSNADLAKTVTTFSGGWRMRAALAGLLLLDPDLLLLDEPTNHLDLPTLAWFDDFLKRSRKALVLISHDRSFLNGQIDRVFAVGAGKVATYTGNYDAYERFVEIEAADREARSIAVEARRAELQQFVDRFGAKASKASQAQSKQKMLDRLEEVEVVEKRRQLRFKFPDAPPSGKEVLRLEHVSKSFGDLRLYQDLTGHIQRGDRIAIVGVNGAGKTTLLKLVANELAPDSGTVTLGHQVVTAYYAQHHAEKLDLGKTVFAELDAMVPNESPAFVRQIAGSFLFSGDDIDKRISVLSGGERARVALAKLLLIPANLLLLDEPTNHLDLDSSEALITALAAYPGTIIFVSHNQSFVSRLATKIWEVDGGRLHPYPGDFASYLYSVKQRRIDAVAESAEPKSTKATNNNKDRRRQDAEARAQKSAVEKPLRLRITKLEQEIATLETQQTSDETAMAAPDFYRDGVRAAEVARGYDQRRLKIEQLYAQWEQTQGELDGLTAEAAN